MYYISKKTKVFLRLSALAMFFSLSLFITGDLIYYLTREAEYHSFENSFDALFNNYSVVAFWRAMQELLPLAIWIFGLFILLIMVFVLLSAKTKPSGIFIMIFATVVFLKSIIDKLIYVVMLAPKTGGSVGDYLKLNSISLLETLGEFILLVVLGLLLVGIFRKASKITGLVLTGAFSIGWIIIVAKMCMEFIRLLNLLEGTDAFSSMASLATVIYLASLQFTYTAYILCSLCGALKPRNNEKNG